MHDGCQAGKLGSLCQGFARDTRDPNFHTKASEFLMLAIIVKKNPVALQELTSPVFELALGPASCQLWLMKLGSANSNSPHSL